jgi:hypothetical protein
MTCECEHPASSIHGWCHKCHSRMPRPTSFGSYNPPMKGSKRSKQPRGIKAQVKRDRIAKTQEG